jgi:hypothetical protein
MRKWIAVAIVLAVVFVTGAAACQPPGHVVQYAYTVTEQAGYNPLYYLNTDSSLVPSINPNAPEACETEVSDVSNRHDYCRLVWGWVGNKDYRDWVVKFTADGNPGGSPPVLANNPGYGYSMTLEDGAQYEGCMPIPNDTYICDYRVTNSFISGGGTCGGWCLSFFLDKLWNWDRYELSADISCVKGLYDVVTKGFHITNTFLVDCTDKPYGG